MTPKGPLVVHKTSELYIYAVQTTVTSPKVAVSRRNSPDSLAGDIRNPDYSNVVVTKKHGSRRLKRKSTVTFLQNLMKHDSEGRGLKREPSSISLPQRAFLREVREAHEDALSTNSQITIEEEKVEEKMIKWPAWILRLFYWTRSGLDTLVPVTYPLVAIVCAVLNALIPGLGTMLAAFSFLVFRHSALIYRDGEEEPTRSQIGFWGRLGLFGANLVIGLMQLFSAVVVLGWIWSVIWAVLLVKQSEHFEELREWYEDADRRQHQPKPTEV